MTNNDVLRRLRYTFNFDDHTMITLFGSGGIDVSRAQVSDWLKKEEDPAFQPLSNVQLASFLNGLIIKNRGKREGPPPAPEPKLNNNVVFRKLKIALQLQSDDILDILSSASRPLSKHELSAFFRKPEHRSYRPCQDQILRNFLKGLQLKYRKNPTASSEKASEKQDTPAKPLPPSVESPEKAPAAKPSVWGNFPKSRGPKRR